MALIQVTPAPPTECFIIFLYDLSRSKLQPVSTTVLLPKAISTKQVPLLVVLVAKIENINAFRWFADENLGWLRQRKILQQISEF